MNHKTATLYGELVKWPSKDRMVALLRASGIRVMEGQYAIRLTDFTDFIISEYEEGLGIPPRIVADAENAATLAEEAQQVSGALSAAGLIHRLQIYEEGTEGMTHYFHHRWPHAGEAPVKSTATVPVE